MERQPVVSGETAKENDVDRGCVSGVIGGGVREAQPSHRQMIRWERFLPRKSIRLLLVEPDDSTRHIVAALLRKCCYHVAAVGDGAKAWELMNEKRYSYDLVLTEVFIPSLSGICLLSKIVGTEESKNIPVIMMSSHDSVGVVLKCMLKGAVDFLVKPVRKNELRNLWQHVWRRHCSGCNRNVSDNNAASNRPSANADNMSESGENSKGNNMPGLGSKQEAKSRAQKSMEPAVIEENQYELENKRISIEDDMKIDRNLQLRGTSDGTGVELATVHEVSHFKDNKLNHSGKSSSFNEQLLPSERNTHFNCQNVYTKNGYSSNVGCSETIVPSKVNFYVQENRILKDDTNKGQVKETYLKDTDESQLFHLSLRRPQFNGFISQELKERCTLNHSQSSAFSRYSERKSVSSFSCVQTKEFVMTNQSGIPFSAKEQRYSSLKLIPGESTLYVPAHCSNGETENSENLFTGIPWEETIVTSADHGFPHNPHQHKFIAVPEIHIRGIPYHAMCAGFGGSLLQPVFHPNSSILHNAPSEPEGCISDDLQPIQLHHPRETDLVEPRGSHFVGVERANEVGHSNGGSSETSADEVMGNACESSLVNNGGRGMVCDHSHRAAALLKFRMKRKDRCFEKKVRYFSRQKLAEKRPRVKGQFVSQKYQAPGAAAELVE